MGEGPWEGRGPWEERGPWEGRVLGGEGALAGEGPGRGGVPGDAELWRGQPVVTRGRRGSRGAAAWGYVRLQHWWAFTELPGEKVILT